MNYSANRSQGAGEPSVSFFRASLLCFDFTARRLRANGRCFGLELVGFFIEIQQIIRIKTHFVYFNGPNGQECRGVREKTGGPSQAPRLYDPRGSCRDGGHGKTRPRAKLGYKATTPRS